MDLKLCQMFIDDCIWRWPSEYLRSEFFCEPVLKLGKSPVAM